MIKFFLLFIYICFLNTLCFKYTYSYDIDDLQKLLKDNECINCDLSEADLRKQNLVGANLEGSNLNKANLWRANLEGANLEGAIFCNTKTDKGIDNSGC